MTSEKINRGSGRWKDRRKQKRKKYKKRHEVSVFSRQPRQTQIMKIMRRGGKREEGKTRKELPSPHLLPS